MEDNLMKQQRPAQTNPEGSMRISFKPRRRILFAVQSGKYRMHLCVRPVFPAFADAMNYSNEGE